MKNPKKKTASAPSGLGMVGGAAAGAAAGSFLGPLGAAVGAVVGGVAGASQGQAAVEKVNRVAAGKNLGNKKGVAKKGINVKPRPKVTKSTKRASKKPAARTKK